MYYIQQADSVVFPSMVRSNSGGNAISGDSIHEAIQYSTAAIVAGSTEKHGGCNPSMPPCMTILHLNQKTQPGLIQNLNT